MQTNRRHAALIKNDEQRVLHRRAPRAFPPVVPRGGLHRRIEQGNPARCAQTFREFHIFHQWKIRKTTEALEHRAPDEDRLIAVKRSAVAREKTHHRFQPREARMPVVELPVESASDDRRVAQSGHDCVEMRGLQIGIRVLKKKHIATRRLRTGVHLRATIRRRKPEQRCAPLLCNALGIRVTRGVYHDCFRDGAYRRELRQKQREARSVAPCRNDDADA